jgi:hypothetical protein
MMPERSKAVGTCTLVLFNLLRLTVVRPVLVSSWSVEGGPKKPWTTGNSVSGLLSHHWLLSMVASEDKLLFAAQIHAAKLVVSGFTSQLAVAAGQVRTLGRPLVCCPHLS